MNDIDYRLKVSHTSKINSQIKNIREGTPETFFKKNVMDILRPSLKELHVKTGKIYSDVFTKRELLRIKITLKQPISNYKEICNKILEELSPVMVVKEVSFLFTESSGRIIQIWL